MKRYPPWVAALSLLLTTPAMAASGEMQPKPMEAAQARTQDAPRLSSLSYFEQDELVRFIDETANRIANSGAYFREYLMPIHIKSRIDLPTESVIIEADQWLGPLADEVDMEDMHSEINNAIYDRVKRFKDFHWLDWRYGGKDFYFWFPEQRITPDPPRRTKRSVPSSEKNSGGSVLISQGHGYYHHYGFGDWRYQRETVNGVTEDEITLMIASPLWAWLTQRGFAVHTARDAAFGIHEASEKPLFHMAARYLIERALPDRADIWNSPPLVGNLREYKQDIRSRPLYANALGVDALISLHTNAGANSEARGIRVVVQPGRPESAALGSLALCTMKDYIHANERYAEFSVADFPDFDNKGENRIANMPSIIVELGFHTNPGDAAALKDPLFLGSSMRGLAKAYQLFRDGKDCEEFEVEVPERTEAYVGDVATIPSHWKGNPEYPMRVTAKTAPCGTDAPCARADALVLKANDELSVEVGYTCRDDDVAKSPFVMSVGARDFDGIGSKEAEIAVTCLPRPEPVASATSARRSDGV